MNHPAVSIRSKLKLTEQCSATHVSGGSAAPGGRGCRGPLGACRGTPPRFAPAGLYSNERSAGAPGSFLWTTRTPSACPRCPTGAAPPCAGVCPRRGLAADEDDIRRLFRVAQSSPRFVFGRGRRRGVTKRIPAPARYSSYASVALYASSSLSPRNLAGARKYAISPGPSLGSLSVR